MTPAISAHGLAKRFDVGRASPRHDNLSEMLRRRGAGAMRALTGRGRHEASEPFWALRDVSFDVAPGEVVGIVGRNGAGKSTLLKVLSRIIEPTSGRAVVRGRMGSLLEVGTGFHPELTGRENIYLNGSVLGMRRHEIARRFDEIVAFAEIERFLDTPVKRYSSGMYVRLAFAVAAHLEPEILVVDEVLAVGDVAFQKKCLGKMGQVARHGRTILFVSHNMAALQQLAPRSLLLQGGRLIDYGPTESIIAAYQEQALGLASKRYDVRDARRPFPHLSRRVAIEWLEQAECPSRIVAADADLVIDVGVRAHDEVPGCRVSLTIFRLDGVPVGSCFSAGTTMLADGEAATLRVRLSDHRLAPGKYYCGVSTGRGDNRSGYEDYDVVLDVVHFEIMSAPGAAGTRAFWTPNWGTIEFAAPRIERVDTACPA